ncbi:MAG: 50S ribosomal protein L29 [Opitutales bacterium]|nr:50S ribosomal protein L29 [Opitutales bacterium]
MKSEDIRALSIPEIEKKVRETRDELTLLRMKKQVGTVEQTHLLRDFRRDIARMLTIIDEKKKAEAVAS